MLARMVLYSLRVYQQVPSLLKGYRGATTC